MPSRSFRTRTIREPHRCCGARVSIGAYGDWHLCEACEMLPSERHLHRGARIARAAEKEGRKTGRADGSRRRR